ALLVPVAMVTAEGTVTRDGDPLTSVTAVALVAFDESAAVHVVAPGAGKLAGAHVKLTSPGGGADPGVWPGWVSGATLPGPVTGTDLPVASEARRPVSVSAADASVVLAI